MATLRVTFEEIAELDRRGLRRFGLQLGALIAAILGLAVPLLYGLRIPVWPWAVGGSLIVWALAAPASLRPVYRGWMRLAQVLQRIVSPVVLSIIYYTVFLPIGALLRLFGRDPMARRLDGDAASYRVISTPSPPEHMKRPF